jgi:hypothetical protein
MRGRVFPLLSIFGITASLGIASQSVHAQGFAALVSPPRFELATQPGKNLRSVIEVSNRSTVPAGTSSIPRTGLLRRTSA